MPSNAAIKQILAQGDPIAYEAVAAAAITPGMLLLRTSAGKVTPHNVAAGVAQPMFAREEEYVGTGYDTDYAINDQVPYYVCRRGDRIWALVATGNNVANGEFLESNGDGTFRKNTHAVTTATTAAAWPVAVALEAVNNASGSPARILVEIL